MIEHKTVIQKLLHYINLDGEVDDFEVIHASIEKDIIFKGTNLWILVFAILVASVGLNMNSTAVIIGAMLISPLMGPITGMGYSIATYNFDLLRKSINNFLFAVAASLVASTTYFAISPVSTAHSELLARTSPTIYDVLIALFGGLAGIVAISSKQKGNVIPGVAIATALMPPLCTAGYGLATGQFYYFFGAIYLFTINTVFIALASAVVSQILKFPITTIVDKAQKNRVNQWISIIIAATLIPSIYFGYMLVQSEKFKENAEQYVDHISIYNGNYLLKYEIDPGSKIIKLIYGGNIITESDFEKLKDLASTFNIKGADIQIEEGFSFDKLNNKTLEFEKLKNELENLNRSIAQKDELIQTLQQKDQTGKNILKEINAIFPQIKSCVYDHSLVFDLDNAKPKSVHILLLTASGRINQSDQNKIIKWLEARLQSKELKVFFDE